MTYALSTSPRSSVTRLAYATFAARNSSADGSAAESWPHCSHTLSRSIAKHTLQFLFILLLALPALGQITQSIVLPATGQAANASVTAQSGDCHEEIAVSWGSLSGTSNIAASNTCGLSIEFDPVNSQIRTFWVQGNAGTGPCTGNYTTVPFSGLTSNHVNIRLQKTIAGGAGLPANTFSVEAWDALTGAVVTIGGPGAGLCTFTTTGGSAPTNGFSVGDLAGASSQTVDFVRVYSNVIARGSQMPVTHPDGTYASNEVVEWKFDNSLADSTGNGFTATLTNTPCVANACYTSTGASQNLVISDPRTLNAPFWTKWTSFNLNVPGTLDGTQSFSQAASSSIVTYSWSQNLSAPDCNGQTLSLSSTTASQPTVTPTLFGKLCWNLQVTDANSNTATTTLKMGAVQYDSNGVVSHPENPLIQQILGPQIAFGQNPWAKKDERDLYALSVQPAFQDANWDQTWETPNTSGTIAYTMNGKGFSPGAACTTLSMGITNSTLSIPVTDATCLSLSSLPTWIMVGTAYNNVELIRICSTTGTTGPQTLTACYDGRGLAGNSGAYINASMQPATAWGMGTGVGEYRLQGTSTLFATDAARPICPAGVPGPPGVVVYSIGTVTLTAGSSTIPGSGVTWGTGTGVVKVGGFILVSATHGGGTAFNYWAQITVVTNTSLTVNRPPPTGVDATAFTYKITDPQMILSLQFTAANGHVANTLSQPLGCESETAMFTQLAHDLGSINGTAMSAMHYSYKKYLSIDSGSNTSSNFYGVGLFARRLWYRCGCGPALNLANKIDEWGVLDPELGSGNGIYQNQPLIFGGTVVGAMVDLALNASTQLHWYDVGNFAVMGEIGAAGCNAYDTRDSSYLGSFLTLAANYDPAAVANGYITALTSLLSRDQTCQRTVAQGYSGKEVGSFATSFSWNPASSVGSTNELVLTNGMTAVTGTGFTNGNSSTLGYCYGVDIVNIHVTNGSSTFTVNSGSLSQQYMIWFWDGSRVGAFEYLLGTPNQFSGVWTGATGDFSAMSTIHAATFGAGPAEIGSIWTGNTDNLTTNQALEKVWQCKWNSSTSLTLFRAWDGDTTNTSPNFNHYNISYANNSGFSQQPFMTGIKSSQMNWASKNSNSTISSGYKAILPNLGNWFETYGSDPLNSKGTFYLAVNQTCGLPTDLAAGVFQTIHGESCGFSGLSPTVTGIARVNSVEGGTAMLQFYLANPTSANKTIVDTFYGAIYGDKTYCAASVLSTCDGTIATNQTNSDLNSTKWPGFFGGIGGFFTDVWPALRTLSLGVGATISGSIPIGGNVIHP